MKKYNQELKSEVCDKLISGPVEKYPIIDYEDLPKNFCRNQAPLRKI